MARIFFTLMLFIYLPATNLLAETENASWGSIKAEFSNAPAGKLVVTQSKAGGWRGWNNQPTARGGRFIVPRSEVSGVINGTMDVNVVNPTRHALAGADVLIAFDPDVFGVDDAFHQPEGFYLASNNHVVGRLKVSLASATGLTGESNILLFMFGFRILPNAVASSKLTAEFVFYDELGKKIGTQTVNWVFDMK